MNAFAWKVAAAAALTLLPVASQARIVRLEIIGLVVRQLRS
jgi:hypothetical protein